MRWILGDTPFKKTLSYFLNKHAFKSVDTHDFYSAVKDVTGQNLDWFFDQWLYKPGHPVFVVKSNWNESESKVMVTIDQVQNREDGIPIFRSPLIISITTKEGKRSEKVWLEQKTEVFEFDCAEKPLLVRFDEGNYLLKEWTYEKTNEELIYQLQNDDVIGRMWAAGELAKYVEAKKVRKTLMEAAEGDPSWAVRKASIESLNLLNDKGLIPFYTDLSKDENSKVRAAVVKILGFFNDPSLTEFFQDCYKRETSYVVKAESIRSLGNLQDENLRLFFEEVKEVNSPRNIVQRAAQWSLDRYNQ